MTERERGPRDWEPSDPDSQWWNPRAGDPYGPSDQEHRQPWEQPAGTRRFPGDPYPGLPPAPIEPAAGNRLPSVPAPPPEPNPPPGPVSPWSELLHGLALMVIAALLVAGGVAVFIGSWRDGALAVIAVATTVGVELAVLGAIAALYHAWPRGERRALRALVAVFAVVALALAPVGLVIVLTEWQWSPGGWLAAGGFILSLPIRIAAARLRGKAEPSDPAEPSPVTGPAEPAAAARPEKATGAATFFAVLAWCLFLAGAGCLVLPAAVQQFLFDDPLHDAGEPISAPTLVTPTPAWSPPADSGTGEDDLDAVIRHDLESRVLLTAGVPGEVASECHRADQQQEFVCTVTYRGVEVRFAVEVDPDGDDYYAEAAMTVLTREVVHGRLSEGFADYRQLRCDPLPAVAVVRPGEPLAQHCYGKPSRFDESEVLEIIPGEVGWPTTLRVRP